MSDTTLTLLRKDELEVPSLVISVLGTDLRIRLGVRPIVVGSAPECDICIVDARVSREHCRFALGERGIVITDLGSKNGTFIGEVRVVEALLSAGGTVTVGSSRLVVHVEGAPSIVPLSLAASFGEAIGTSLRMRALFAQLERIAPTNATVLLLGETGTGKEVLARALHAQSSRRDRPFEVLDCAALAPGIVEGELFGWERGAFTGATHAQAGLLARAHGGTLFIDELGELPLDIQPKLLRVLETGQVRPLGGEWRSVDVRVICATHRDLRARCAEGLFREDLYYRVAVATADVPPLRERKEDIPLLCERFLAAQLPPRTIEDLPPGALSLLAAHDWPGNVRELWNTVARLVLFPDIAREIGEAGAKPSLAAVSHLPLREARALVVEGFEREYVASKLRDHAGNVSRAAEAMGVSRQFLHRLMDRYGIRRDPAW